MAAHSAQLSAPPVRRYKIEPQSTFELIAELALALSGFAGVATAFGGRDRSYLPIEMARLQSLFVHSFMALAISLLAISLLSFELDPKTGYFWSSCVGALGQAPTAGYFVRRAYGFASDPTASTGWWGFWLTACGTILSALLFGTSVALGGSPGVLISALSVQLLFGLWVFMRLLVHRY